MFGWVEDCLSASSSGSRCMHGKWRRGPQARERHSLLRRTPRINLPQHLSDCLRVIGAGDHPGTERHRSISPDSPAVGIQAEWLLSLAQMRDRAWKVIYRRLPITAFTMTFQVGNDLKTHLWNPMHKTFLRIKGMPPDRHHSGRLYIFRLVYKKTSYPSHISMHFKNAIAFLF
jgi:hypothetical protein